MPSTFEHEEPDAMPPDGGYGWICVFALFLVNFSTWGAVASFGLYLSYYLDTQRYPDASELEFALVGGFNFAFAMIAAPFVTALTHRFGRTWTMPTGIILQTSGYIAAGFTVRIWQLMITHGALVGLGIGFIYVPSLPILSQWFQARRSLANGLASAGSGFGAILFVWSTKAVIDALGLRWALCITGIITFALSTIGTGLLRDRNKDIQPPESAFDTSLLAKYEVILLLAWSFISMLGYITLLFSLPDFALSIGLSSQQATNLVGFLNIGTAIGRPMLGFVSDKLNRFDVTAGLTFICGLSCFAFWIPTQSYGLLIFFGIISGAVLGVFWMAIGPLCVEVAGLKNLQSLLSLSWAMIILPTTFSEVIALKIRRPDADRPYLFPQLFVGIAYICAGIVMLELRRINRKRRRGATLSEDGPSGG